MRDFCGGFAGSRKPTGRAEPLAPHEAITRAEKRVSSRFQSNHHRGYFCRNTIISGGPATSTPPDPIVMTVASDPVPPE